MYLVNDSLVGNKNSPLRKKIVDELQLATSIRGYAYGRVMSGEYNLTIDLRPGVTPEQVMPIVDEVIAEYLAEGPDEQIVENAKLGVKMYILGALETGAQIGRMLAQGELFSKDPLFINKELEWLNAATADELRQIADRWLTRGYYQLTVEPFPEYKTAKLVVANRGNIPLVDVSIQIDTGSIAAPEDAPGLPTFVFGLLNKGTKKYNANELAAAQDKIAMGGSFSAGDERSSLGYRILKSNLLPSLELAAEMLRHPTFPDEELEKQKAQIRAYLANLEQAPSRAAGSMFNRAIYGAASSLGSVWTPQLVEQVDRARLKAWHAAEVAPDNMTIYMIGDVNIDDATEAVNQALGKWKAKNQSAARPIGAAVDNAERVILIDYPGAASSTIMAGRAIPPFNAETWGTLSMMNRTLGGAFEARLNMNLREDKGWSYGYYSRILQNRSGDMTFRTGGQVQTDKTAEAMTEVKRELDEFVSSRPATDIELARIKLNRVRSLPGSFATNSGFLGSIISSDSYQLPFDYAETSADRIEAVTLDDVRAVAEDLIDSSKMTWVIVGDLEKIEEQVRALQLGEVEVWDAFGGEVR
jgi:zinc protease